MNMKQPLPLPPPGITVRDVYYVLFRHKWMIAALSLLAVAAAIAVRFAWPVPYQSEAKLLIKWVTDTRAPGQMSSDVKSMSPDERGANIITSELEILTSQDVITQVVDVIGASNLLARLGGGSNAMSAAVYIRLHLLPEVPKGSDVITLTFSHPDPAMPQQVLSRVIEAYLKKHNEIHRPEFSDFLRGEIDQVKGNLTETEKQLHAAKENANIISLEDSEKQAGEETARIEREIRETEAESAAEQSMIKDRERILALAMSPRSAANAPALTNRELPVSPAVVAQYQRNSALLVSLRTKEQELLNIYTTNNVLVQSTQSQIAQTEATCKQMEEQNPSLLAVRPAAGPVTAAPGPAGPDPRILLNEEIFRADALTVKYQVLTNQLAQERAKSASISGSEGTIIELQRNKEVYEKQLAYYRGRLEEARADQAIGPGNSSISSVESPTGVSQDLKKLTKASIGILLGGLALAWALPFLIEFYFDQSFKRASDVQGKLGVPSFIIFPKLAGNGKFRSLKGAKEVPLLPAGGSPAPANEPEKAAAAPANGAITPWDDQHALRPFFETLRDRLMTYFEMINLTHKPKLVAVTSCSHNAGVTTTAAGLASSLSETGDGNVLLVDMNVRDGEAHHFYKGKLTCRLEEVLEKDKREDAMVHDNLYIAKDTDANDKLPRVLPKRFSHLVPKMRASDYDYIIFDMPPISQISITPRLARFMDMVLLVIEAEKTDSEIAKRATTLLTESKTNVGVVLNKSREYLPRRLQQDI
jgi:Mrp family chromosome partitioning ATPase/uncharacterized protein involved in exopolysaccharide biosynthesis